MRDRAPRRLVVRVEPGDAGAHVGAFVGRALAAASDAESGDEAVGRGAVFVDGRRIADATLALSAGQTVQVTLRAPRPTAEGEADRAEEGARALVVLHEDQDVIALDKPAGVSSSPDLSDRAGSLLGLAEARFGSGLHLLGRLDREVTGVVIVLRTARARAAAAELRRAGGIERTYRCIVSPPPEWEELLVDAAIGRDPRDARRRAVAGVDAQPAQTRLVRVERLACGAALVEARPVTGRTHQIRVHLAHAGHPIVGDRTYGGARRLTLPSGEILGAPRVLLHAARLSMRHPGGRGPLVVEAPLPADFRDLLERLARRP